MDIITPRLKLIPCDEITLKKISSNASEEGWWTYLPIEREKALLIGSCGYKGPPDEGDGLIWRWELEKS